MWIDFKLNHSASESTRAQEECQIHDILKKEINCFFQKIMLMNNLADVEKTLNANKIGESVDHKSFILANIIFHVN